MLFADDVMLIDENRIEIDHKLELWRRTLESKEFRLSMIKSKYIRCQFSGYSSDGRDVSLDRQIITVKDTF
jgi:hypothetical protein